MAFAGLTRVRCADGRVHKTLVSLIDVAFPPPPSISSPLPSPAGKPVLVCSCFLSSDLQTDELTVLTQRVSACLPWPRTPALLSVGLKVARAPRLHRHRQRLRTRIVIPFQVQVLLRGAWGTDRQGTYSISRIIFFSSTFGERLVDITRLLVSHHCAQNEPPKLPKWTQGTNVPWLRPVICSAPGALSTP